MAKRLNSVLGVDIGSQQIKVAEVRRIGNVPSVTALGVVPTPPGAVDHTAIFNPEAVGQAIKDAVKQSGASVKAMVVSLAGQSSVLVRTLDVPRMNEDELREHMQWEINRNIPFTESTIVSDYRPIPNGDPNSQNMEVVMAIAPQSAVNSLLALAKKAGKSIAAIDVEPLGLARLLRSNYDDLYGGRTVCVVEIGHKTSSINIFKGDYLVMPRQVLLGGELFTQEIARAYGVGEEEAEEIKRSRVDLHGFSAAAPSFFGDPTGGYGGETTQFTSYNPFAGDTGVDEPAPMADEPAADLTPQVDDSDKGKTYRAMQSLLEEMVSEIRRSIDYYRGRGDDVHQILVCGGGSKLKGLPEYLQKSLEMPCDAFDPLRRLNVSAKRLPEGFLAEHGADFAVAVGNGLHPFVD